MSAPQRQQDCLLMALLLLLALQLGFRSLVMSPGNVQAVASLEQLAAFNQSQLCRLGDTGTPHAAHDERQGHCLICFVHLIAGRPVTVEMRAQRVVAAPPLGEVWAVVAAAVRLADPRAPPGLT
ncbi:hypothetical protein CSW30_14240 [Thermus scotoductus]|nr:hypothetical protein CSW30_14240 [Thermus scotoductus]